MGTAKRRTPPSQTFRRGQPPRARNRCRSLRCRQDNTAEVHRRPPRATCGHVTFEGNEVKGTPPGLAVVFQDYSRSLFPWFSVGKNVELPLRAARVPKSERTLRVTEALQAVGLDGAHEKKPHQLSGGMQQRVA